MNIFLPAGKNDLGRFGIPESAKRQTACHVHLPEGLSTFCQSPQTDMLHI